MGSFLAEKFNSNYELIVVDKNLNVATHLSDKLKCLGSNSYDVLDKADIIVLALPTEVMVEAVKQITQKLTKSPVLVNIATTASDTELEKTFNNKKNKVGSC
jgi:pyrroline-5-carboxylate reductase